MIQKAVGGGNRDKDQSGKLDLSREGTRSSRTRYLLDIRRLGRFLACLGLLVRPLSPGRHVAAVAAVELLGNVVVTSWAPTPIVLFGFHLSRPHFQICLFPLSAVIVAK